MKGGAESDKEWLEVSQKACGRKAGKYEYNVLEENNMEHLFSLPLLIFHSIRPVRFLLVSVHPY